MGRFDLMVFLSDGTHLVTHPFSVVAWDRRSYPNQREYIKRYVQIMHHGYSEGTFCVSTAAKVPVEGLPFAKDYFPPFLFRVGPDGKFV